MSHSTRFRIPEGEAFYTSFMDGHQLRWRPVPVLGLKLRMCDLMEHALKHELCDGRLEKCKEHDTMFLTFHETATLICECFTDPDVAKIQIALLSNLLRRGREKYIFKQESIQPLKRDLEAFRRKQLMPLAGSAARIQTFVHHHHANKRLRELDGAPPPANGMAPPPVDPVAPPPVDPVAQLPVNDGQPPGQSNDADGKTDTQIYCLGFVLTAC